MAIKPFLQKLQSQSRTGRQVSTLLLSIDRFEQHLPELIRQLRRKGTAVPTAPPRLTIRSLGRTQVKQNDRLIPGSEWRQFSARDILFLLLAYPEGLNKEQIGLICWPDSSPGELKLRFKNAIYRLRHAVGANVICFENNIYRFNHDLNYAYDVELFQNEIVLADQSDEADKKIAHYKSALRLYKGVYLPEIEGSWVLAERQRLEDAFFKALLKIATIHLDNNQFDLALKHCQHSLDIFPEYEEAHYLAMQIYEKMGNKAAAIRQYETCRRTLLEDYGASPSDQTRALYEKLLY